MPDRKHIYVAGTPLRKLLDRAALCGIGLGFVLVFQPWGGLLRSGFWVTLLCTILHVFTSHMQLPDSAYAQEGSAAAPSPLEGED